MHVRNVIDRHGKRTGEIQNYCLVCIRKQAYVLLLYARRGKFYYRLRSEFQENPNESIEFSDLHSMLLEAFPGSTCSCSSAVSHLVQAAFPNARSKRVGQQRVTRLVGIQKRQPTPQIDPDQLLVELQLERERRIALEQEVSMLKEQLDQGSGAVVQLLRSEIDQAASLKQTVMHGPDTLEWFQEFSMGTVIEELKASCPNVYSLQKQLADTDRNAREGVLPGEELKVVMALCTLLKMGI